MGDIIEIGETFGRVESIGARSNTIRTFDNFHIIVPNGAFLDQNVINWTHSDDRVRVWLKVGVACGSPTRRVEELILKAIRGLDEDFAAGRRQMVDDLHDDVGLSRDEPEFRKLSW
jgi:small-conductance mechanosensitive channel